MTQKRRREAILEAVANGVGREPISATEYQQRYSCRRTLGTISRWFATLYHKGVLDRRWDGNQRFGRYVYFRKAR
jgi:hypothetical protein